VSFGQSVSYCFSNYTNFTGRARRSEFWWFYLAVLIISAVVQGLLAVILGADSVVYYLLSAVVSIALVIPLYAAGARRLHDTGKSGWLQLLLLIPCVGVIALIVFWAQAGQPTENQYGPPVA
jgi:uncharacterized membrane protein YhaH (DUF805 family)